MMKKWIMCLCIAVTCAIGQMLPARTGWVSIVYPVEHSTKERAALSHSDEPPLAMKPVGWIAGISPNEGQGVGCELRITGSATALPELYIMRDGEDTPYILDRATWNDSTLAFEYEITLCDIAPGNLEIQLVIPPGVPETINRTVKVNLVENCPPCDAAEKIAALKHTKEPPQ